jgi:hypothetical protein
MFKRLPSCCSIAVLVIALSLAGCGEGSGTAAPPDSSNNGSTETSSANTTTTTPSTTTTAPTVDRAVVRWKKRWATKIQRPMRHAASILEANAILAVNGDSAASYRLTAAFNTLSNCRNPLDLPPLSPTPSVLGKARRLTLAACREFYVGVDGVIEGLNTSSSAAAQAGVSHVRDGERTLKRAARLVKSAPITTP